MWAGRSAVHISTGRARRGAGGVARFGVVKGAAIGVVAGDAARSMEDRQRAVGIFVDADGRLDEVAAQRAFGGLQGSGAITPGVVVGDDALRVTAQDVAPR